MLALALAVVVAEDVGQDPEQPGLAVGARLEGVEEAVGAQQRVLDQVLGVLFVAGHAQRGRVEGAADEGALPVRNRLLEVAVSSVSVHPSLKTAARFWLFHASNIPR